MFNYHVAAGMKTVGISAAGGVAEATVDEIVDGYTKYDMYELGINRFLGLHNNKRFLRDRMKEVPGMKELIQIINTFFSNSITIYFIDGQECITAYLTLSMSSKWVVIYGCLRYTRL